jgi:tetratricopeptide (TPR) repeat protein
MFREDYILRLIAQVTAAIGEILGLKRLGRYPEALAEVERALGRFLGLNLSLVSALPAVELVELTRLGERLDIGKLVVLADLLQAEGDIYVAQGQNGQAEICFLKALELLLEVAFDAEPNLIAVAPRVAALQQRVIGSEVPGDLGEWLAHFQATVAALASGPVPAAE